MKYPTVKNISDVCVRVHPSYRATAHYAFFVFRSGWSFTISGNLFFQRNITSVCEPPSSRLHQTRLICFTKWWCFFGGDSEGIGWTGGFSEARLRKHSCYQCLHCGHLIGHSFHGGSRHLGPRNICGSVWIWGAPEPPKICTFHIVTHSQAQHSNRIMSLKFPVYWNTLDVKNLSTEKIPGVDMPNFFPEKTSETLTRQGLGQYLLEASRVEVSRLGPWKLEVWNPENMGYLGTLCYMIPFAKNHFQVPC